jgi:putative membrane protein insertion efficiency factor
MMQVMRPVSSLASGVIVGLVWFYRVTLGWLLGGHCRYQPSCSEYMIQAVRKHGPVRGAWRGMKRIGRCHPWGGGGWDPP